MGSYIRACVILSMLIAMERSSKRESSAAVRECPLHVAMVHATEGLLLC